MYEILIKSDFSGAHNLRGYRGRCERLHGHNWKAEVRFIAESLDNTGMAADFKILKNKLNNTLEKLDHEYLNNLPAFRKDNPSAENIARYVYKALERSVDKKSISVKSVSIWESDNSCATYFEKP